MRTVGDWLEKGRRAPDGRYGVFARAVDVARAGRRLPPSDERDELDEEELRRLVARTARSGSVPAMKLYYETWLRGVVEGVTPHVDDPLAEVDELARKRAVH